MSTPEALAARTHVPFGRRMFVRVVVGVARVLAKLPPSRLSALMTRARGNAPAASAAQALRAREEVTSTSLHCAGEGCLPRSIATALLCRVRGRWPTWCVGARLEPFLAHAWVEAEGRPVGEPFQDGYFGVLMRVPPRADTAA
ncbi:lasso peptide biosynthesis B2 protein [Streptomyces alkaliterrae]|uniref:Lasso peptide biosynthesis B2 protein n=1 Tax=Streptomyces alkaliterrae TaxID=2213162 RepID=A0A5P0YKM0_9ACTN|nr:lasso peptide biosynthesis B2 protein [Streptomyces alkaliterrae]MBB1252706.1 lasso peptide biosynthesis B2 protein [Streptomyces alkaliterrae]MBB1258886.1 lasso peptide biosynthesis B2 protein [Streptomyces alkaliterrae]MQS00865.1 lasso peptide biosynthesis B2 protein [Streptomyces alkaliterrae]